MVLNGKIKGKSLTGLKRCTLSDDRSDHVKDIYSCHLNVHLQLFFSSLFKKYSFTWIIAKRKVC